MKRMLLALLLNTFICSADEQTGTIIRSAKDIVLHLKDAKSPTTIHLADAPYISQDVITLYPGDKIIVEFDLVDSQPKNPRVVKEITHPERTLELEMTQDKDITAVNRKSGFAKKLSMDSYFFTLGSDFKNHANMYPLDKSLPCFDSFEPKTYCIKFYSFGFAD
jgi:hypothetical protein